MALTPSVVKPEGQLVHTSCLPPREKVPRAQPAQEGKVPTVPAGQPAERGAARGWVGGAWHGLASGGGMACTWQARRGCSRLLRRSRCAGMALRMAPVARLAGVA